MLFHEYETVIILRPDLEDEVINASVEKVERVLAENGGTLLIRDDWGKRRLAYTIEKQVKGHYFLLHHVSPAELLSELERIIRIDDNIIRFMSVKLGHGVDVATLVETAREKAAERERMKAEVADESDDDDNLNY